MNTTIKVISLNQYSTVCVSGSDAKTFLQNQLTSDILKLQPMSAGYTGHCSIKGRLLTSAIVCNINNDDHYLLILPKAMAENFINRLKRYVLRSDINLIDQTLTYKLTGVIYESNNQSMYRGIDLRSIPLFGLLESEDDIFLQLPENRVLELSKRKTMKSDQKEPNQLNFKLGSIDDWNLGNVRAGIVEIVPELEDQFLPQSIYFQKYNGVSFEKGCFPGQEIVARAHYLGNIKRRLFRASATACCMIGDVVIDSTTEKKVGIVTTVGKKTKTGFEMLIVISTSESGKKLCVVLNTGVPHPIKSIFEYAKIAD